MPHDTPLITTIVAGLVLAFLLGAIANRLRLSPLVGYLLAGVLIGPGTPGFVADTELAPELAEIGVVLLMFGVGLHFSLRDLLSVKAIAVPGALAQIALATAWSSASRSRSPAPSCSCARWRSAGWSRRSAGGSPSAG
jgi:CPA2 family monovalent cation:H+ antiporter-2